MSIINFEYDSQIYTNTIGEFETMNREIFMMADSFLMISGMTHKKLQKLCYYAKAWYLALYDWNLVHDSFEAWVHGAVNVDLYHKYASYGFSVIPRINDENLDIPEEYIGFAKEIYNSYGHLDGNELERLNHSEPPWIQARGTLKSWELCNNVISEESMKEYYRRLLNVKNSQTGTV